MFLILVRRVKETQIGHLQESSELVTDQENVSHRVNILGRSMSTEYVVNCFLSAPSMHALLVARRGPRDLQLLPCVGTGTTYFI